MHPANEQPTRPRGWLTCRRAAVHLVSCRLSPASSFDKDVASKRWQESNAFEWQKALAAELDEPPQKYPYLFCHKGVDAATGNNPSGFRRQEAMKAAVAAAAVNGTDDASPFRVLYNEDDYLCAYGQMLASTALAITGDELVVQPLVQSLKYISGSVAGLQKGTDAKGGGVSIDAVLCPGVAVADANATADSDGEWEPLSDETVDWILEKLMPTRIASKLANSIADTYYLTSQAYKTAAADTGEDVSERSKLWQSLMEEYQESGKCDETYASRLTWAIQYARDPELESSVLHIGVNTTGKSDVEAGCLLTLSMAIAAHPNVCSLEKREGIGTHNQMVTWLTQSEVAESRPLFDAGLDGTGQVVAVSDTGIDRDNCYFAEPDGDANASARAAQSRVRRRALTAARHPSLVSGRSSSTRTHGRWCSTGPSWTITTWSTATVCSCGLPESSLKTGPTTHSFMAFSPITGTQAPTLPGRWRASATTAP